MIMIRTRTVRELFISACIGGANRGLLRSLQAGLLPTLSKTAKGWGTLSWDGKYKTKLVERVAGCTGSIGEAALEPLRALRRCPVGKSLRSEEHPSELQPQ